MSYDFKKAYNTIMIKSDKQVYKKNMLFYSFENFEVYIDTLKKQKNDKILELYYKNLKFALLFEYDNRVFLSSKYYEKEKSKKLFQEFMSKINNE